MAMHAAPVDRWYAEPVVRQSGMGDDGQGVRLEL